MKHAIKSVEYRSLKHVRNYRRTYLRYYLFICFVRNSNLNTHLAFLQKRCGKIHKGKTIENI